MQAILSPLPKPWLSGLIWLLCIPQILSAQSISWEGKWSVGLRTGISQIRGDVETGWGNLQLGGYAQKSLRKYVDVRLQLLSGSNTGQDLSLTRGFQFNSAWNDVRDSALFYPSSREVILNYRTRYLNGGLIFKFNLNQWIRKQGFESWNVYGMVGLGGILYRTRINAISESEGGLYNFESLESLIAAGNEDAVREAIANLQDNTYETPGQQADFSPTQLGENVLKLTLLTGGGASLQLTESFRIGAEVNFILTGDDLLDGQQWNDDNTVSDTQDRLVGISLTGEYFF